ncbi:MAG TPA: amino acid racemase [Patescibacteria group bacterium]|nr:amino acid racemase [Patescibacteria group bacterium]
MKNKQQIIGLVGGMGPFAGVAFCRLLLEKSSRNFGAKNADDFPEIILDSVRIPDFISDTKNLPMAKRTLVSRVRRLSKFGCTTIAMVCNTGHILFPILSKVSTCKMISIIEVVKNKVVSSKLKRVGLLATRTTFKSNIFTNAFIGTDVEIVIPNEEIVNICEDVIRSVIANKLSDKHTTELLRVVDKFVKEQELDGIVLGCTELPLAFPKDRSKNIIDCLDVLSDKLLNDFFGLSD